MIWLLLLVAVSAGAEEPVAEPLPSMRLRLEWGSGERRVWNGELRVSQGRLLDPIALGIEADTPGTLRLDGDRLLLRHRTRRAYAGLDVTVQAPLDATLIIKLQAADAHAGAGPEGAVPGAQPIEIPLRQFLHGQSETALDTEGNELLVYRLPSDTLRVELDYPHMIFEPGETLSGRLTVPLLSGLSREASVQWELRPARATDALATGELGRLESGQTGPVQFPLEITLPETEGVYTVHFAVIGQGRFGQFRQLRLYERQVQLVVLAAASGRSVDDAPTVEADGADAGAQLVDEIDPSAKGGGWTAFLAGRTLRAPKVTLQARKTSLGTFVEMRRRTAQPVESWVAYRLRIRHPGRPHRVEVDHPENHQQSLAISIVEPNAAGRVWPVGHDSGLYTGDPGNLREELGRHELLFWPRSGSPWLLLTDLSKHVTAEFGRIRVYELPDAASLGGTVEAAPPKQGLGGAFRRATNQAIQFVNQPKGPARSAASESSDPDNTPQARPQSPDEAADSDGEAASAPLTASAPSRVAAQADAAAPPGAVASAPRSPERVANVRSGLSNGAADQRLFGPYTSKPLFPETFGAREQLERTSRRSLDDWVTFWEGAHRLVAYLKRQGYNSMVVAVLADGSTIYPSKLLEPTPRYDMGVFFPDGQDPVRKDVLELLFRLFDREGLVLIPELQFTAPLPALERMLAEAPPGTQRLDGVRLIGADGRNWLERFGSFRGAAPYYNPLDPHVQQEMLRVVGELADRYRDHVSFGGLAIQLSANGYAQFPGLDWGYDAGTIARFAADAHITLPQLTGRVDRTAQYYRMLTQRVVPGPGQAPGNVEPRRDLRREWLNWRSRMLADLHERFAQRLRAARGAARLYLTTTHALAGSVGASAVYAELQEGGPVEQLLLERGIDRRMTASTREIVWLRPSRVGTIEHLRGGALDLDVNTSPELDEVFRNSPVPGALFFHRPYTQRLVSFERAGLPWKDTYMQLVAQLSPSGADNRRRFAHALASLDAQVLFDGGWLIPMGQERALTEWIEAYRRLPPAAFTAVEPKNPSRSIQPVVVRRYATAERTVLYLVNDSPWTVSANVRIDAPPNTPLEQYTAEGSLSLKPAGAGASRLECQLGAYGLCVAVLSLGNLEVSDVAVQVPASVKSGLEAEIASLDRRSYQRPSADESQRLKTSLRNAGFEQPQTQDASPARDWTFEAVDRFGRAQRDAENAREGSWSLRCSSRGTLTSAAFPSPGQPFLGMKVWLRADRDGVSVRLALQGKTAEGSYVRRSRPVRIGREWGEYMFRVFDLPHEQLEQLRARLELIQEADVWIDAVELVAFPLKPEEELQLVRTVNNARVAVLNGRLSDCRRLLDSYWARFIKEQLPDPAGAEDDTAVLTRRPQSRH